MDENDQLKHLEMVQSVINRLAGNSFLIKGWAITISLAGFGLFVNSDYKPAFLVLVAFAAFIFWVLDAYYLKQERSFRRLYEDVANIQNQKNKKGAKILSMDTSRYRNEVSNMLGVMLSFPTVLIYALIFAMIGALYYILVHFQLKGVRFLWREECFSVFTISMFGR